MPFEAELFYITHYQFLFGILSSNDVKKWTPMTANNPDEMRQKHAFLITQLAVKIVLWSLNDQPQDQILKRVSPIAIA